MCNFVQLNQPSENLIGFVERILLVAPFLFATICLEALNLFYVLFLDGEFAYIILLISMHFTLL